MCVCMHVKEMSNCDFNCDIQEINFFHDSGFDAHVTIAVYEKAFSLF